MSARLSPRSMPRGIDVAICVFQLCLRNALVPGRRPRKFPAPKSEPVFREKKFNDSD